MESLEKVYFIEDKSVTCGVPSVLCGASLSPSGAGLWRAVSGPYLANINVTGYRALSTQSHMPQPTTSDFLNQPRTSRVDGKIIFIP